MNHLAGDFRLRSNLDFEVLRARLRCEHGPALQSEDIAGSLSDADKDLEDCDTEVDRLQSRLIVLQNQRRLLEEYRAQLDFLRSPIRRLPNETIAWIFDFVCDMNELTSKKLESIPTLAISSVCMRWRKIVRARPSLWSCIRLAIHSIPPNKFPILDLYLESSQQSPLTLEITGSEDDRELEPRHLAVCATLIAHVSRWQHLTVVGAWEFYVSLTNDPRSYPALKTLTLPETEFHPGGLEDYEDAPQLCSLSVFSMPSVDISTIQFPWKNLRCLAIRQHSAGMWNILDKCKNLTELCFWEEDDADGYRFLSLPATASAIKTLTLFVTQTTSSESLAEVVFTSITCPSLTSLLLEATDEYKRLWPNEALYGFISRSSCPLTTLSIKSIPLSDSGLINLLQCIPSLLHLTIDDSRLPFSSAAQYKPTIPSPITSQFIQRLHAFPSPTSSVLAKRLQTLHLTFTGYNFKDGEFIDMLLSRWLPDDNHGLFAGKFLNSRVGTVCLRSAVMHFKNRAVNENCYKQLRHVEKAGMRVVVIGTNSKV